MNSIQKLWSIYRITWLLYLGILLMPLGIFWVYHQMGGVVQGAQVVREISQSGGEMLHYTIVNDAKTQEKIRSDIERSLASATLWYRAHKTTKLYVGAVSPWHDFQKLRTCWQGLRENPQINKALHCWQIARSLAFATERSNMLVFDQIRNYLFLAMALSIGLLFLLVYVVRFYMYHQVCKSIVHSPEEGLHDREYCRLSLIQFCAQSDRTKRPLSTMIIQVDKNRKHSDQRVETLAEGLLKMESILKKGTRLSDVICRISDNQFFLIMPNTDEGGSQMAVARIKKMIRDKLGRYAEHLDVQLKAVTRVPEEKCTAFWKRASKKL